MRNDFFANHVNFCVLYFTMTEVGQINLVLVGTVDIYFVNVGSQRPPYQENS